MVSCGIGALEFVHQIVTARSLAAATAFAAGDASIFYSSGPVTSAKQSQIANLVDSVCCILCLANEIRENEE